MNIPLVGKKTSQILAKHFSSLDEIMSCSKETLSTLEDVGEITSLAIIDYFHDKDNIEVINKLRENGVNFLSKKEKEVKDNFFKGKRFVITGTLTVSREEMTKRLESLGAISSSAVSKNTDFLLAGEKAGSKYTKAQALNVKIFSENEISSLIEESEEKILL